MRLNRITLAALFAVALPVTAAQSHIDTRQPSSPVKGWTAVAGLSGPAVLELARGLPSSTADLGSDQPWCDAAPVVQQSLDREFEERMVTRRDDGTQLWGSDLTGTWTVILNRADRTSCVIASGTGYQDGANPAAYYAKVGLNG